MQNHIQNVLVAGGGIAGLASAIALRLFSSNVHVTVLEQAPLFSELGAGIQLGPNALSALHHLGISSEELKATACTPHAIEIRNVTTGKRIASMQLGSAVQQRFGHVYLTIRRADLHQLLLQHAQKLGVDLQTNVHVQQLQQHSTQLELNVLHKENHESTTLSADALVVADGVHGTLRDNILPNGGSPLRRTGHWAYRATVATNNTSTHWQSNVGVWWGKAMHVVHYPVASGKQINIVLLLENHKIANLQNALPSHTSTNKTGWSQCIDAGAMTDLLQTHTAVDGQLTQLLRLPTEWGMWELTDRKPDNACAKDNALLVGDAAHPMLPYLAQGAAMALEDAAQLLACLQNTSSSTQTDLTDFASVFNNVQRLRLKRNARVQNTAYRNGRIFHLSGLPALARDAVLAVQGDDLRLPWLYGWQPIR